MMQVRLETNKPPSICVLEDVHVITKSIIRRGSRDLTAVCQCGHFVVSKTVEQGVFKEGTRSEVAKNAARQFTKC